MPHEKQPPDVRPEQLTTSEEDEIYGVTFCPYCLCDLSIPEPHESFCQLAEDGDESA